MAVDPRFKGLVRTDATALLRPKTGLKDMFVEIVPGSRGARAAPAGFTIPLANTLPDVNPDEILAALRPGHPRLPPAPRPGAGEGLRGGGGRLQDVFARFAPTHRDLAAVTRAVGARHRNLAHLIHSISVLDQALAERGRRSGRSSGSSSAAFGAIASEQASLGSAVHLLPGRSGRRRGRSGRSRASPRSSTRRRSRSVRWRRR